MVHDRITNPSPEFTASLAKSIVSRLVNAGFEAYFAGGCVRDMLLGHEPDDYDIATSARVNDIERIFVHTVPVGAQFGVMLVVEDGIEFQVATFRADSTYTDGRRPDAVTFTTAEGDAQRRDFTINGMFYDPLQHRVIDFVGGSADLDRRIVRAIGDPRARFEEDRLRILRGVRIAAVLDFELDDLTRDAILEFAHRIHTVSAERIRDELAKVFLSPRRVRGFDLLDQCGLLEELLPEVAAMKGVHQPPEFHPEGDVFVHTRLMLSLLGGKVSLPLVLGVLFHDIGKPPTFQRDETGRIRFSGHEHVSADLTQQIMERLRFSNAETGATVEVVRNHMAFKDVQKMRLAKLKRFMARPTFEDELELHRVDCAGSHGMLDNYEFLKRKREEFANQPLIPRPLVSGYDLIALGWKPGPRFREVLDTVQNLQLEGALTARDDAIAWIKANYGADPVKAA